MPIIKPNNNMQTNKITKTYPNGTKLEYEINELGQMHGSYKSWHYNENKSVECTYQNDKKNGLYKNWYSSGVLNFICTNKKNQSFGTRIQFW